MPFLRQNLWAPSEIIPNIGTAPTPSGAVGDSAPMNPMLVFLGGLAAGVVACKLFGEPPHHARSIFETHLTHISVEAPRQAFFCSSIIVDTTVLCDGTFFPPFAVKKTSIAAAPVRLLPSRNTCP